MDLRGRKKAKILIIDNYDSFTYNLVQQIGGLGGQPLVVRNDASLSQLQALSPSHLVISPGPGDSSNAGVSSSAMEYFAGKIPVLGVCLGMQVMGTMRGAKLVRAPVPVHGKTSVIEHDGRGVFAGLSLRPTFARYHSLVLSADHFPNDLIVTARCEGLIMGIRHRSVPRWEGVQFHPESFMSQEGDRLMKNFM
ncbi:MAG: aminodeoxychorismate/anthranilate synthase component II [Deltaproteobacteria bacterium]|nr:aminodeoxychorismate/anthranilate synthase component II [Deltaproteobacteria bacterium]